MPRQPAGIVASVAVSSKACKFGQARDEAFHLLAAVVPVLPEKKRAPVPMACDQSLQDPLSHFSIAAVLRDESQPGGGMGVLAEQLHAAQRDRHVLAVFVPQFRWLLRERQRSAHGQPGGNISMLPAQLRGEVGANVVRGSGRPKRGCRKIRNADNHL